LSCHSLLDGIPDSLPALLESHELGVRAANAGFDWRAAESLLDKIREEVTEIRAELSRGQTDASRLQEEAGDLLFAAANLARYLHSDAESCLRRANRKFRRRFQALEDRARRRGESIAECSAEKLDALWEEVKKSERA
jgi:ATP diphosphatase